MRTLSCLDEDITIVDDDGKMWCELLKTPSAARSCKGEMIFPLSILLQVCHCCPYAFALMLNVIIMFIVYQLLR